LGRGLRGLLILNKNTAKKLLIWEEEKTGAKVQMLGRTA
jgi:hypothetical protein